MVGVLIEFAYFEGKEQSVFEDVVEFKTERAALTFFNDLLCDDYGTDDLDGVPAKMTALINDLSDGESLDLTMTMTRVGKVSVTRGMNILYCRLMSAEEMERNHRNENCWTHDFNFNFSFSGLSADWETDLSAADIRARIITSLGNCDAEELLQRVECYNSFSQRED